MAVAITAETPLQDDVRELVHELNAYLIPLSPREFQFQMTVEQMAESATTLFVARDEAGNALGMGALKLHSPELGEVKRMFTRPAARGKGVGVKLLQRIVAEARERGLSRLVLETGVGEQMQPAWRLYQSGGFTRCGPVLDYPDSGWSAFFEMSLAQETLPSA